MTTTWWKRCYEALRGARFLSPFLRFFFLQSVNYWNLFHLFCEFSLAVLVGVGLLCLFVCLLCFGVASENSAFNCRFRSFADFQWLTDHVPCSLGNAGKKTFATALSSLSPVERYEAEFMGASEFLNRRVNEELQRAFEAGVPYIHRLKYITLEPQVIVRLQKVFEV